MEGVTVQQVTIWGVGGREQGDGRGRKERRDNPTLLPSGRGREGRRRGGEGREGKWERTAEG